MIPRTFPSTFDPVSGETQMKVKKLTNVIGLTRWRDYIPIKFTTVGTGRNTYSTAVLVDPNMTGSVAWVDHIPVYEDTAATTAWQVSDVGFIPYNTAGASTLNLDFGNNNTLDSRITFTRASSATRVNSSGLIESVASGVPRFDYDPITLACRGLLIEEARTNLVTYSDHPRIGMGAWQVTLTDTAIPTPYGAGAAVKLVENTTNNAHNSNAPTSVTSGTTYTFSVFVKAAERTSASIALNPNNSAFAYSEVSVDLTTGACVVLTGSPLSYGAVQFPNGWWRLHITGTATATALSYPSIGPRTTSSIYTGDGTSGIYVYGPQMEAGAFPTSYVPSATSFTSRASTATFIGSNGLIQTAASGVARYSYNPLNLSVSPALLLEAAATNLLPYSQEFDNAAWVKYGTVSVTPNTHAAPDGTLTADTVSIAASSGVYRIVVATANTAYSGSIYIRGDTTQTVRVLSNTDISGFVGTTVTVTPQWQRVAVQKTTGASDTVVSLQVDSSSTGAPFQIWGAQLEPGSYPTSYIPTTSAQVTRAADVSSSSAATRAAEVAVMTGANFSSWWNATEGTVVCNFSTPVDFASGFPIPYEISDTTASNRIVAAVNAGGNSLNMEIVNAGATVFGGYPAYVSGSTSIAQAYKLNDANHAKDGVAGTTDASVALPTVTQLSIGNGRGFSQLNGHIRSLRYYPARLSNAQLQALTL